MMKRKVYRCTLLSDIIINQKAATEGNQNTLDFIPGSNFLGIAASAIYPDPDLTDSEKMEIFHSGHVRFGDAHPLFNGQRTVLILGRYQAAGIRTVRCPLNRGCASPKRT